MWEQERQHVAAKWLLLLRSLLLSTVAAAAAAVSGCCSCCQQHFRPHFLLFALLCLLFMSSLFKCHLCLPFYFIVFAVVVVSLVVMCDVEFPAGLWCIKFVIALSSFVCVKCNSLCVAGVCMW